MNRDPRQDPRPGDVLAIMGVTYKVKDRWRDWIYYETDHPESRGWDNLTLAKWETDMFLAEVIHCA